MDAGKVAVFAGLVVYAVVVLWVLAVCWVGVKKGPQVPSGRALGDEVEERKYTITGK